MPEAEPMGILINFASDKNSELQAMEVLYQLMSNQTAIQLTHDQKMRAVAWIADLVAREPNGDPHA